MKNPLVFIVLVNWNGCRDTIDCINSLKKIDYPNYRILVVDNGSTDGSQKKIKTLFKDVLLIENKENVGLAKAENQGISLALKKNADFVLLLNNDMTVEKDFLSKLVKETLKHPSIAMSGGKILYHSDKNTIWSAGLKERYFVEPISRGLGQKDKGQFDKIEFVDSVHACSLLNAEVIKEIGLLHSDFFIMFEESEWGIRARRKGYKVLYIPSSVVYHKVSKSFEKIKECKPFIVYFTVRNWLVTVKRNFGYPRFFITFVFELLFFSFYRISKFILKKQFSSINAYFYALSDALLDKMPKRFIN